MQIFENIYAKALKLFDQKQLITDSVTELLPKSKAELYQNPIYAANAIGYTCGVIGSATGISYVNDLLFNTVEVYTFLSLTSFGILWAIDLGKKYFQYSTLTAWRTGDPQPILAFGFLFFAFCSFWASWQGVENYFAEKNLPNASKTVNLVNLDSIRNYYDLQIEPKKGELSETKETAAGLAKVWNKEAKNFSADAKEIRGEIKQLEAIKRQEIAKYEQINQSKISNAQSKQSAKDTQYVAITIILELISLAQVFFVSYAKAQIAKNQVALQKDLQGTIKPITIDPPREFVQTQSLQDEVLEIKQGLQLLTASLQGTNLGIAHDVARSKTGFKIGNGTENLRSAQDVALHGTGCKTEEEFVVKYKDLIEAIRTGYMDSRNLCNTYKANLVSVNYAKYVVNKEVK